MAHARAGTVLDGRYQLGSSIAEGSMGCVYRASRTREGRRLAVKIMSSEIAADDSFRARFLREAEALSRLQHERVVSILDFGVSEDGLHYLVMDEVDGSSLAQEAGPMDADRVARLLIQVARGLAHAHERGVVHRDLKPDNIMIGPGGDDDVRLVDFGIAMLCDGEVGEERLTARGLAIGTPEYMSPEQLTSHPVDARSDLFALGVIGYELLCGLHPFEGSRMQIARQIVTDDAPPCSVRAPRVMVDRDLDSIVRSLLARDPASRPESARELKARLESWLARRDLTVGPYVIKPMVVELFVAEAEAEAEAEAPVPVAVAEESPAIVTRKKFMETLAIFAFPRPTLSPAVEERISAMLQVVKRRGAAQLAYAAMVAAAVVGLVGMAAASLASTVRSPGRVAIEQSAPRHEAAMRRVWSVPAESEAAVITAVAPAPAPVPAPRGVVVVVNARTPAPAPVAAAPAPLTAADFDRLYRAVGERLGDGASDELARQYLAIPYADALRSPAVLDSAMKRLRALDTATR